MQNDSSPSGPVLWYRKLRAEILALQILQSPLIRMSTNLHVTNGLTERQTWFFEY